MNEQSEEKAFHVQVSLEKAGLNEINIVLSCRGPEHVSEMAGREA